MKVVNKIEERYDTPFWRRQNMTIDDFPTVQRFRPECSCKRELDLLLRSEAFEHEKRCNSLYEWFKENNIEINNNLFIQMVDETINLVVKNSTESLRMVASFYEYKAKTS